MQRWEIENRIRGFLRPELIDWIEEELFSTYNHGYDNGYERGHSEGYEEGYLYGRADDQIGGKK